MRTRSRAVHFLLLALLACFIYVLIAGGFIFAHNPVEPMTESEASSYRASLTRDVDSAEAKVALVEGNTFAGLARIDLLRRAQDTLEISSHQVTGGKGADVFFSEILAAAERGVEVRIILDGLFAGLRRLADGLEKAILAHPNIRIAFYEPLDLLRPWTIQNRFHDKIIIVDGSILLTGGRNIGSRYFLYELEENSAITPLRDRDVLVFGEGTMDPRHRHEKASADHLASIPVAVKEARDYFEQVWAHEWTQPQTGPEWDTNTAKESARHIRRSRDLVANVIESPATTVNDEPRQLPVEWEKYAVTAETVRFFTNPLERMNKTPTVLRTLAAFLQAAEQEALIQSPFFVTHPSMETILGNFPRDNQILLTNAPATNPNWFAVSGYLNQRGLLAGRAGALYEYQGYDSIHAKAFLIDSRYSFIGAFNMDPRSAFLSTESMLFIESEVFGRKHKEAMHTLIGESLAIVAGDGGLSAVPREGVTVSEAGILKRTALQVMRVFARPLAFLL